MKKRLFISMVAVIMLTLHAGSQTYLPIATNGYSLDGVAENTTAATTTGGALDASDFVLYSQYYGTLFSTSATGLPNNGLIASGTRTYQLQPYTGFNVVHLFAAGMDSLNFITPQPFPSISLLGFGTQGAATASITVRFTDNTTQIFNPITMDDWFGTSPAVYNGFDRALRTTGAPALVGSAGNPKMFAFDLAILCANQGKPIKSVKIKNNSTAAHLCVMAVSGAVPAYSITASPASLCSGGSATLSAIGLTSYSWQPVSNFAGSNAATVVITPTTTATYTLLGDNAGCPAYAAASIIVSGGLPNLSFTGSTPSVCLGAAATISVNGALNYTLSNSIVNGVAFTPSTTAVYTVTGANGCGNTTQTVSVLVAPLQVTASTPTPIVCSGVATTLSAGGAATYTWLPGNGSTANFIVFPTANTSYTVIGKTGNCLGSNTINLTTKPVPSLALTPATTSICVGDSVNLSVTGNALTYTWTPGNQTATSIYVSPTQLTLYSVVGTNSVNCTSTVQQAIFVNTNPVISVSAINPTVCTGGNATVIATGATTYSWNQVSGPATNILNPTTTSVYTVSGSFATGCKSSNTVIVNVYIPTLAVNANTSVCFGSSVTLQAGTAVTYTWNNGLPGQQVVIVGPTLTTVYTVSASVLGPGLIKCPASNTVQVSVNALPTISITSNRTNTNICSGEPVKLTGQGAGATGTYTWSTGQTTPTLSFNLTSTKVYTVTGTDANGCVSTGTFSLKVVTCTGLKEIDAAQGGLVMYPNPSHGVLHLKSEVTLDLIVMNEMGQVVDKLSLTATNNFHETLENLATGIYFVSTTNSQEVYRQKIVILK